VRRHLGKHEGVPAAIASGPTDEIAPGIGHRGNRGAGNVATIVAVASVVWVRGPD